MWPAHLPNKSKEKCACSSAMVSSGYSKGKFLINCVAPFFLQKQHIPDICHKYHKLDMWRKICHVEKFQIYMHDRCGEIWLFSTCWVIWKISTWQMWRNLKFLHIWHVYDVVNVFTYVHVMLFCLKKGFIVIYTVLLQNLFCHDLRTFVWRKMEPNIAYVEKKWQISGMKQHWVTVQLFSR